MTAVGNIKTLAIMPRCKIWFRRVARPYTRFNIMTSINRPAPPANGASRSLPDNRKRVVVDHVDNGKEKNKIY
jgi:hypothetical protein